MVTLIPTLIVSTQLASDTIRWNFATLHLVFCTAEEEAALLGHAAAGCTGWFLTLLAENSGEKNVCGTGCVPGCAAPTLLCFHSASPLLVQCIKDQRFPTVAQSAGLNKWPTLHFQQCILDQWAIVHCQFSSLLLARSCELLHLFRASLTVISFAAFAWVDAFDFMHSFHGFNLL